MVFVARRNVQLPLLVADQQELIFINQYRWFAPSLDFSRNCFLIH